MRRRSSRSSDGSRSSWFRTIPHILPPTTSKDQSVPAGSTRFLRPMIALPLTQTSANFHPSHRRRSPESSTLTITHRMRVQSREPLSGANYSSVSLITRSASSCMSAISTKEIPASDCSNTALPLSRKYLADATFLVEGGKVTLLSEGTLSTWT